MSYSDDYVFAKIIIGISRIQSLARENSFLASQKIPRIKMYRVYNRYYIIPGNPSSRWRLTSLRKT